MINLNALPAFHPSFKKMIIDSSFHLKDVVCLTASFIFIQDPANYLTTNELAAPILWNSIPEHIKSASSLSTFNTARHLPPSR